MSHRSHPPASGPLPDADDEQLACGRMLSHVWAAWEDGTSDEHQRDCPHCRAAVDGLQNLESAVRDLQSQRFEIRFDTAALTERVMDLVHLELRPGRPLPLGNPGEDLWLMEAVAARVLRPAAERVSGVRAGSCRLVPEPDHGEQVRVRLVIHAPAAAPSLPELADEVRAEVARAADAQLGLAVAGVDVVITDLTEPPTGTDANSTDANSTDANSTEEGHRR